jgi:hypothetical protein
MPSPQLKKEIKMGIKSLVGKKMTKKVKFMGEEIEISKLSVAEVMDIQEKAKGLKEDDTEGFNVLKAVIRSAVADANELSDEDFAAFPMDELSKLSDEIMKFSGLGKDSGK